MGRILNNVSIATKAWVLLGLTVAMLLLAGGISWSMIKDAIVHERRAMLVDIVDVAHGVIARQYEAQRNGLLSEQEAQQAAIEALRPFRYGKNGYVFVYQGGVAKLAPDNPANEGKDLSDFVDANGLNVASEMTRMTANGGAGFLSYYWHHPGRLDETVEKLSYARGFEPWGWFVGTGIYQDDIDSILAGLLKRKGWLLVVTGLILAAFVTLGFTLTDGSIRRLFRLKRELHHLSKGDLTREITVDGSDELGQMAASVKTVQKHIRKAATDLTRIGNALLDDINGIAASNGDLSERIVTQASDLSDIDATLRQIAAITSECEQAVARATATASASEASIGRGEAVVSRAIDSMEQITASSERVTDIVGVIDDLAFQTNLLALNAAVEAARAGDQGKGFAVVANEVRNLAQRSADSARQIRELIEESSQNVRIGTDLVNQSGALLREIVKNYGEVSKLLGEVSEASSHQTRDIARTSTQLNQLNRYSQENLALVASARSASEQVRDNAERMQRELSFFRLPASPRGQRQTTAATATGDQPNDIAGTESKVA